MKYSNFLSYIVVANIKVSLKFQQIRSSQSKLFPTVFHGMFNSDDKLAFTFRERVDFIKKFVSISFTDFL